MDEENRLLIRGDNIYRKLFIHENKGKIPETLWDNVSNAANASDEIKKIFTNIIFDTPKPIPYITEMMKIATTKDSIVLDFFSGSSTTAHAVMQLNAEDGGNRKFIMVQIPEETDEKSEAYKFLKEQNKPTNICEIGKERIRRAGAKIAEEAGLLARNLDTGFRMLKLESTNMKDVYYSPAELNVSMFDELADNIKNDRNSEDLLFQVMLDLGVLLSSKVEEIIIDGKKYLMWKRTFLLHALTRI